MRPIPWPDPSLSAGAIVLRPWRDADRPAVVAACRDPLIARFIPSIPQPYRDAHAHAWIARQEPARRAGVGIELAIARAAAGAGDDVLGAIAVLPIDWAHGTGAVGYWLAPAARGDGVATTALGLLAGWAFDVLGLDRIELTADVANAASQRVATRCGFVREALLRNHLVSPGQRRDTVLYAKPAPS